ncbi:DUF87 domain-containing protein [Gemmata sp. JC717]|uniref:helicase HerA domain-containing protein n=1 Tax=Gemmata algarum TaxID=2975278 RepID=UPI0021BB0E3B|nr:DUF87 domain-containing protein [Gemmata algarum]MDY3553546.1 DUF87 domain-containing protein [Gemmata algarum]
MSPTASVLPASAPAATDPRVAAYCSPDGPEVFSGVVFGSQLWTTDPFDVGAVHPEARAAFDRLLARASDADLPPHGKSLLLLGEAGCGKTHLMRAFRTAAHESGAGYCGYLQMLSRSDNYSRYILSYLLDSLEQPYKPGDPTTGLMRLARGLLDAIGIADADRDKLLSDWLEPDETARIVFRFADIAAQDERFAGIDLNLLRAVLFLLPNDGRIRPRALSWLRCEDLAKYDREMLGDLVPRPGPEMPLKTIVGLGRLMRAVHSAAFVLLVDQLDEMIELAKGDSEPGELFRCAINTLIDIADALPNAVVVIGCLRELFGNAKDKGFLPRPKLDRLEHDPEALSLTDLRTGDEVCAMLARRLEVFFGAVGVEQDPLNPLAPYTAVNVTQLAGLRTRDILDRFRNHREQCIRDGKFTGTDLIKKGTKPEEKPRTAVDFGRLWAALVPKAKPPNVDEPKLAELLGWVIGAATDEMSNGLVFSSDPSDRFVQVEVQCGNAADKLLVGVCDKTSKGGHLGRQLDDTVKRAGELPAVFVRSTEFPNSPGTETAKQVAKLCVPIGKHRKAVIVNADWRAMAAFRQFVKEHEKTDGFGAWRQQVRPLANLPSLRRVLDLDRLETAAPKPLPPAPPLPPAGLAKAAAPAAVPAPVTPPATPAKATGAIRFAVTRGALPAPVELEPKSLCRHAAFLGGSGSGKTTAALAIIEELLLAGVPAVLLDRKGDLAQYADPAAWAAPEPDADRAARRARLRAAIDVQLYTPGTNEGRPLAISIAPPGLATAPASEREQHAQYAAAGLAQMMGYRSRGIDPKLVILQKAIEVLAAAGSAVTVDTLQKLVSDQDDALLMEFDGQYEERHFRTLRQDLYSLGARHRRLFEAPEALDIDALLGRGAFAAPGRTRLTVLNTGALGDAATVDFWVSQLLLALDQWRQRHPAPGALQAVFLFDEADAYLPAVGKPATKGPMESLLRRARSAGLGLFLATQSPGDFDYKCRDQITTWLVGQVKQPVAIEKLKPVLQSKPGAADRVADQKVGEFWLVREGDVRAIQAARNLIPTEQLSEDRILELARAGRAV